MSNEAAAETPAPESAESVEPAEPVESLEPAAPLEAPEPEGAERAPVVEEVQREVTLQRSVRYGRVIVGSAALGAVVAAIAALFFPIEEGAEYTMAQAVGFFAVLGAAIGLGLGGLAALVLGLVARRQRGTGVAIQSDVR
ncbi:hypothetical protein [Leucobacter sp.]